MRDIKMDKGKKSIQSTLIGSKPIAMRESRSEGMKVRSLFATLSCPPPSAIVRLPQ